MECDTIQQDKQALKRLVVIVPAYNEEDMIANTLRELHSVKEAIQEKGFEMHICVIDDGSTDATYQLAQENGATHIVKHPINIGLGAGVRSGIRYACENHFDILVKFDADLQHDPQDIPRLIEPILNDEADVVYGNRFRKIAYKMPFIRRMGNRFFTGLMTFLTGWPIKDSQPGIFAINKNYIKVSLLPGNYNYTQQILIDACLKNMRFAQVDVAFNKRETGKSFVSLKYPFKVIPQILLIIATVRPMSIFAPAGLAFFSVGTIIFIVEIIMWMCGIFDRPVENVNLVLGCLLFGLQTLFFGLLAQIIIQTRK